MSIEPKSYYRVLTVFVFSVLVIALTAFGFSQRTDASLFDVMNSGLARITGTQPPDQNGKADKGQVKPVTRQGMPTEKILFGLGDLPYSSAKRRDKIMSIDPILGGTTGDLGSVNDFEPSLSPDGRTIVFVSIRDAPTNATGYARDSYRTIYTMNADGSNQTRVYTAYSGPVANPRFSPDGSKLIYAADYSPYGQPGGIYVYDLMAGSTTFLSDGSGCDDYEDKQSKKPRKSTVAESDSLYLGYDSPSYSPDGQYVVFGRIGYDGEQVVRIDAASGKNCKVLYQADSYTEGRPKFSPDGSEIAVYNSVQILSGSPNGYSINEIKLIDPEYGSVLDSIERSDLTNMFDWSPDGDKLVYAADVTDPQTGAVHSNSEIRTVQTQYPFAASQIYTSENNEGIRGVFWGNVSNETPSASLKINSPNPLMGGYQTTATVHLADPAAAGGYTFNIWTLGEIGIISAPSTVTVAEGETDATFPINSIIRNDDGRTADVAVQYYVPGVTYLFAEATLSLQKTKPDLEAVSLSAPANTAPNINFPIAAVVKNAGIVPITGTGGVDRVYFSVDNQYSSDDTYLVGSSYGSLAAGSSRTLNTTVSIPAAAVPSAGDFFLILRANDTGAVDEGGHTENNQMVVPIHLDLPDLIAKDLIVPSVTEPGVTYTLKWDLKDQGTVNVGATSSTYVYFSFDDVAGNSDDVYLASVSTPAIAAGASIVQTANVKIPTVPVLPTGSAFFYVVADANNTVNEGQPTAAGEMNNTLFAPTQFDYKVPDLQVVNSGVPPEVESDTAFAFSWTTQNTGNKDAGAFTERVYFSKDYAEGSDILLGTFPLTGLAAGASVDRIQNVTIPTSAIDATGSYYIYAKTDALSNLDEGVNENNNLRFQQVYVRKLLRPDLKVTTITAPTTAFFMRTVTVQWTVTNQGHGPTNLSNWRDRINLNTTGSNTASTSLIEVDNASVLNPGESYTTSVNVDIPKGYVGNYQFVVTADIGGKLNESDATNNKLTKNIVLNAPPLPDLKVSTVQAPAEGFAGQPFEVHWTVENIGNADAQNDDKVKMNKPWSWEDSVYLSRDTVFNPADDIRIYRGAGRANVPLAPGSSYSQNTFTGQTSTDPGYYVKLPNSVSGLYYVFVVTDSNNDVYEYTGEGNNSEYDRVQPGSPVNIIRTPADLTITDLMTAPSDVIAGNSYEMSFIVKNQGAFGTNASWIDGIYLSEDAQAGDDDRSIFTKNNSGIAGGDSKTVSGSVQIPYCFQGPLYLIPRTDIGNAQSEFDPNYDAEANNNGPAKAVNVASFPPDLIGSSVTISTPVTPGSMITVNWIESNIGTGIGPSSWTDRITLIGPAGTSPVRLGEIRMTGALSPGATVMRSALVALPQYMQDTYHIRIETDYGKHASECGSGTENNVAESSDFSVTNNLPDLIPGSISTNLSAYTAGDPISITFNETDQGQSPAIGQSGWATSAYLSTDTSLSNNDYLIGTVISNTALGAGSSRQLAINGMIGNVPAGNYRVLVLSDIANKVYEGPAGSIYETNNVQASDPIVVGQPSIDLIPVINSVSIPSYSGQSLICNYTVTNVGALPTLTGSWTDKIYLSRDSVFDRSDPMVGYHVNTANILTGGASYNVSVGINIPSGLTGDYRLFVITDAASKVVQDNRTNDQSPAFPITLTLPPPADLTLTDVSSDPTIIPGSTFGVSFTTHNNGPNAAPRAWRNSFYLSKNQFWDGDDVLLGNFDRSEGSPMAAGISETKTAYFNAPMIPEGTYYVIARVDSRNNVRELDEANNILSSAAVTQVDVQTLPLGTPETWQAYTGAQRLYKFLPPVNETVLVTLNGGEGSWNRLFTNASTPASLAQHDFEDNGERSPDKENLIPFTDADKYYSLVKADFVPSEDNFQSAKRSADASSASPSLPTPVPETLTLKAETIPFSIRTVSPAKAGNSGITSLYIKGAKFREGAAAKLVGAKGDELTARFVYLRPEMLQAIFDLTGKDAGSYTVVVTNPDGKSVSKNNALTVVSGGGHDLRMHVDGPTSLIYGTTKPRYTINVANDGLNDAQAVPFVFAFPSWINYQIDPVNKMDYPAELLPQGVTADQIQWDLDIDGTRYVFMLLPIVRAHTTAHIGITLFTHVGDGYTVGYGLANPLTDIDDSQPIVGPSAEGLTQMGQIVHPGSKLLMAPTISETDLNNCYIEWLRSLAFYLASLIPGAECANSIRYLVVRTADLVTGTAFAGSTGSLDGPSAVLSALGFIMTTAEKIAECAGAEIPPLKLFNLVWGAGNLIKQAIDCLGQTYLYVTYPRSLDPNDKVGPDGYGPERFVGINQPLEYRIGFENVSSATAPAQRVYISDELPPGLDPRTVRLKEISFGHYNYVISDNSAVYQSRQQLGDDLNDLKADISAGLNIADRRVTWTLTAIDPQTGEMPIDPLLGLLPPNNDDHDGEGYVIFTVQGDASVANLTTISNTATIIFDDNEPIVTNAAVNKLDNVTPASQLNAIDPVSEYQTVPVSWTGTDDMNGSGIASCVVSASENGSSFRPFISSDQLNGAATLDLKWGKTYGLYTTCTDNAGNIERSPETPDATVRIHGGDTEGDVAPRPDGSDGIVNNDDVSEIRRFAARLDGAMQYNEFQRADTAPRVTAGDARISLADVMQARRYALGIDARTEAAGPEQPDGNSALTGTAKTSPAGSAREVNVVLVQRNANHLRIGIMMDRTGNETGVSFGLNFDPSILSNASVSAAVEGSSPALTVNDSDAVAGKLGIMLDESPSSPFSAGTLLLAFIDFDVIPSPPATTLISFGNNVIDNETVDGHAEILATTYRSANIQLLSPTAGETSVSGKIVSQQGTALSSARVTMLSATGKRYVATSNPFGYFAITGLTAGETYSVSAEAKGYSFPSRMLTVSDNIAGLELVGTQQ